MIGDIYLALKNWLKQQTCIHDYGEINFIPLIGENREYRVCKKCERWHWL